MGDGHLGKKNDAPIITDSPAATTQSTQDTSCIVVADGGVYEPELGTIGIKDATTMVGGAR
jgi:hypothetical protein